MAFDDRRPERDGSDRYPPIADYGFIGDGHSVALVSRHGSIDWCCMPRLDLASCFGRLLDWERGGYAAIRPTAERPESSRGYLDGSLVLETLFRTPSGAARVLDAFAMRSGGREAPYRQLLRIVEGVEGEVELDVAVVPRLDYGAISPWIRRHDDGLFTALGGHLGLILWSDLGLEMGDDRDLVARTTVRAGERYRLSIRCDEPHRLYPAEPEAVGAEEIDRRFEATVEWWRRWSGQARLDGPAPARHRVLRSAVVIKGLINAPTGAIVAAATTSLPERIGGDRNWDYRFSWVRDSSFALQSLAGLGFDKEAHGFRLFIERTTADTVEDLQVVYGVGGEHRLPELELPHLEGYRGSRPVRIGNDAWGQVQLDIYGELVELAWRSASQGRPPEEEYWKLLVRVIERVTEAWREPDRGIWEVRSEPLHFVHSKAMCWSALDRGARLVEEYGLDGPADRWRRAADEVRAAIEERGYDRERGVFVRSFDSRDLDAALLLLPRAGFVDYRDERMVRTVDAVVEELGEDHGLLRRYRTEDGVEGEEGAFLACSFWLVECWARQGKRREAEELFERLSGLANDLGLYSEQVDAASGEMLGNFPQGLTHYAHIAAALAVAAG